MTDERKLFRRPAEQTLIRYTKDNGRGFRCQVLGIISYQYPIGHGAVFTCLFIVACSLQLFFQRSHCKQFFVWRITHTMGSSDLISTAALLAGAWQYYLHVTQALQFLIMYVTLSSQRSCSTIVTAFTTISTNSQIFCSLESHWAQHDTRASWIAIMASLVFGCSHEAGLYDQTWLAIETTWQHSSSG